MSSRAGCAPASAGVLGESLMAESPLGLAVCTAQHHPAQSLWQTVRNASRFKRENRNRSYRNIMRLQGQGLGSLVMRESLSLEQKRKRGSKSTELLLFCSQGSVQGRFPGGEWRSSAEGRPSWPRVDKGLEKRLVGDYRSVQHRSRELGVIPVSLSSYFRET